MKALFDTNILIDYLNGIEAARTEIERPADRLVSIITWMEVLAGAGDDEEEEVIEMFLRDFRVVESHPAGSPAGGWHPARPAHPSAGRHRVGVGACRVRAARHAQHERLSWQ